MAKAKPSRFKAPFLKRITLPVPPEDAPGYAFKLPLFKDGFEAKFECAITIIVGENGSGKSTVLEAIAHHCGFNVRGGNRNQGADNHADVATIAEALRFGWLPRVTDGFFMRAESFVTFIDGLEATTRDPDAYAGPEKVWYSYGGKSLHERSHGEAFLALFSNRFGRRGVYLLDEPEAALSPDRQLALMRILHELAAKGEAQIIMATHSPILMFQPGAQVLALEEGALVPRSPGELRHVKLYARFLAAPEKMAADVVRDEPDATDDDGVG